MKLFKVFGGLFALLLLVVIGLVVFVFTNLNQIVKQSVETVGPEVTETHVGLRDVDIELLDGKGELNHFVIGNPQGFSSEHLIKWDTIRVQIDPMSVKEDVVVIKDITIEGVNIIAEQKGTRTNLQALLDTLQGHSGGSAVSPDEGGGQGGGSDVRLALEHLHFADNSIDFVTENFGSYTLDLPAFELNNIGDKNTGLTPAEFGIAIVEPLLKQAKKAVEKRLEGLAKEKLKEVLDAKKAELKAKADEKEAELKAKVDEKEAQLKAEKDKLKEKLGEDAENKLKGLFDRD